LRLLVGREDTVEVCAEPPQAASRATVRETTTTPVAPLLVIAVELEC
jgi:hypothetical protein